MIKHGNLSDDEWIQLRDEIVAFVKSDAAEEEKAYFTPFGWLETVTIICDGI